MLNNADKEGHIFEGKHKPFTNKDIVAMLGVYIINGLAPSPQLTQEMQPQSKQPTHGNNKVASTIREGLPEEAQFVLAFLRVPGSFADSSTQRSMPKLQGR